VIHLPLQGGVDLIPQGGTHRYGGGMGLWFSDCLDATALSGISFWVRGDTPTDTATVTLLMEETEPPTPPTAGSVIGSCPGTSPDECVHPSHVFMVTDTWTEIRVPWSSFSAGNAAGTSVVVDGHNLFQIQFDVGLEWVPRDDVYEPVAAPYELLLDELTFY